MHGELEQEPNAMAQVAHGAKVVSRCLLKNVLLQQHPSHILGDAVECIVQGAQRVRQIHVAGASCCT